MCFRANIVVADRGRYEVVCNTSYTLLLLSVIDRSMQLAQINQITNQQTEQTK